MRVARGLSRERIGIGLGLAVTFAFPAFADPVLSENAIEVAASEATRKLEPVIVVTSILPEDMARLAGSGTIIDAARLGAMNARTAKEVLRLSPGVAVVEEDALGLKLNVSVRGLNPRRSSRTLLMEDGVPIQPAPYADPSAHYYPPLDRVERIELRRGSGQIPYGPQSVGGMINFVTAPAPSNRLARLRLEGGERGLASGHLALGFGKDSFGTGLFLTRKSIDGIRTGHDTQVSEAIWRTRMSLDETQALDLKIGTYRETTGLTEGGLNQARFEADPYANPFKDDRFELERTSGALSHIWTPGADLTVSTQFYATDLFRASYRQADTSIDAMVANPATGCTGAARTNYEVFAPLCGNKMRPRNFEIRGIDTRLLWDTAALGGDLQIAAGARTHVEDTDRKRYNGLISVARENSPGTLLRDHNRIETNAHSGFLTAAWTSGAVTVTPGIRIEHVETANTSFTANFVATGLSSDTSETTWLPGAGIVWTPRESFSFFAGIHRGFAPPRPDRDLDPVAPFSRVKPETSTETEIGVRWSPSPENRLEATVFDMRLEDIIVEGALVGGRSGSFVNAGKALHQGLELSGKWTLDEVTFLGAWSYLATARFESEVDLGASGVRGNRVPYAPEQMADAALQWRPFEGLELEIGVNYLGEQFADAGNTRVASADGLLGIIPDRTLWRASLNIPLKKSDSRFFVTVDNLTDEVYISSRVDGLFAGNPRIASVGFAANF